MDDREVVLLKHSQAPIMEEGGAISQYGERLF